MNHSMKLKSFRRAIGPAGALFVLLIIGLGVSAHPASVSSFASFASGEFFFPPYPSDSDRMGIGSSIGMYNPVLKAGWYMDWGANSNPPHPDGMEYVRTISFNIHDTGTVCVGRQAPAWQRSQVTESITGTALIDNLRANPGALWLIGNEPDSIYNGSPIMPELYAELYHEFYTFIKAQDPSARVAIGAIVQPSPLRLEYLDKVLNHYQSLYGEKLPTALWNMHMYTLREVACEYGSGTPPGATSNGWLYDLYQWSDFNLLQQHLPGMRQWMAAHGERDKPLIITEFGVLVPDNGKYCRDPNDPSSCITQETSRDYLRDTINYLLTTTDANTGYPADGNRLIQMWAWYSLYDSYYGYGGNLVNSDGTLTPAGQAFAQIASQHFVPYVDLYSVPLITPTIPTDSSGPLSVSLAVQLDNRGNTLASSVPVRFAQYDYASGQLLASDLSTVNQVFARYGGIQPQVSYEWQLAPATMYTLTFEIDPAQTIIQARRSEQQLAYPVGWAADLAVTSLTSDLPPTFAWIGPVTCTVRATIRNVGNLTSSASIVYFSGFAPTTEGTGYLPLDLPALAPNASTDISATLAIPSPGLYIVTATVEYAGLDLNRQNNTATLNILAATHWLYLPLMLR